LQDKVSRLHSVREDGREMDRVFPGTQQLEDRPTPAAAETQTAPIPTLMESATSGESGGWKLVPPGNKRKAPAPPKSLQIGSPPSKLKRQQICF